jgi:hypothetical protein
MLNVVYSSEGKSTGGKRAAKSYERRIRRACSHPLNMVPLNLMFGCYSLFPNNTWRFSIFPNYFYCYYYYYYYYYYIFLNFQYLKIRSHFMLYSKHKWHNCSVRQTWSGNTNLLTRAFLTHFFSLYILGFSFWFCKCLRNVKVFTIY